jgi:hypothetical protein
MLRVLNAATFPTYMVYIVITELMYAVKIVHPGKQESCSCPGCVDAVFLYST